MKQPLFHFTALGTAAHANERDGKTWYKHVACFPLVIYYVPLSVSAVAYACLLNVAVLDCVGVEHQKEKALQDGSWFAGIMWNGGKLGDRRACSRAAPPQASLHNQIGHIELRCQVMWWICTFALERINTVRRWIKMR